MQIEEIEDGLQEIVPRLHGDAAMRDDDFIEHRADHIAVLRAAGAVAHRAACGAGFIHDMRGIRAETLQDRRVALAGILLIDAGGIAERVIHRADQDVARLVELDRPFVILHREDLVIRVAEHHSAVQDVHVLRPIAVL